MQNCSKLSAAVHELSTVYLDFGQLYTLIANISLTEHAIDKWNNDNMNNDVFHVRQNNLVNLGPLTRK